MDTGMKVYYFFLLMPPSSDIETNQSTVLAQPHEFLQTPDNISLHP